MPLPGLHFLAALDLLAATTKKSSGSSAFFFIFLVIIAGVYFLFIAPQRRRQRAQLNQQRSYDVGDEVITTGGIYGRVESSDGDRVALDIAEGVIVEVARTAIARRVESAAPTSSGSEPAPDEEATPSSLAAFGPPEGDEDGDERARANGMAPKASGEWADPFEAPPSEGDKGAQ